jgi:hypothetical protein
MKPDFQWNSLVSPIPGIGALTGTFWRFRSAQITSVLALQLLLVFRDVGLVAGFGDSLHKRVPACGR